MAGKTPLVIAWLKRLWSRLRGKERTEKQKFGDAGESAAAKFLAKECGMTILVRNWRSPADKRDEIDIVCRTTEGVLVFVEVKTRPAGNQFQGYASIDRRKKEILKRAAKSYLRGLGARRHEISYRFDIVVVERSEDGQHIPHHLENVPLFSR